MPDRRLASAAARLLWESGPLKLSADTDRELLTRFLEAHDEAAFAELVRRHDRLVRSAVAKVLTDPHDAEDAFQATFLVLVRRARSLDRRAGLGPWLYGVAHRVAVKARDAGRRRAAKEAVATSASPEAPDISWREACELLHAELDRLPDRYRLPLLLCYLEGRTRDEAAAVLNLTPGTVKGRLERGREVLRERLARRGVSLSAGLLAAIAAGRAGAGPAPSPAAILDVARGTVSARVVALTREVTMVSVLSMFGKGLVVVLGVAALTAAALTAGGAAPPAGTPDAQPEGGPPAAAKAAGPKGGDGLREQATVSGRVLTPDGKPLPGAEILSVGAGAAPQKLGVSAADGRFAVSIPRGRGRPNLVAAAAGFGVAFAELDLPGAEVVLRTVKDRPVRGRVVDTQGKPVAGATVEVRHVAAYGDTLDPFLVDWQTRDSHYGLLGWARCLSPEGPAPFPAATTDADGRFTMAGAGDERLVVLRVSGPGIARDDLWVVNRGGFDPKPYNQVAASRFAAASGSDYAWMVKLHGPDAEVVAEAEKPVRGTVTDKDTSRPRPGVRVTLLQHGLDSDLTATTDAAGQYEFRGARKARSYPILVASDGVTGHVATTVRCDDTPGYTPVTVDVAVRKGVIVTGRVLDKATGKPLPGFATVLPCNDNKFVADFPAFDPGTGYDEVRTGADGTFRCVTVPGSVLLMGGPDPGRMPDGELGYFRYKPAVADPKYPQYFRTFRGGVTAFLTPVGINPLKGSYARVLDLKPGAGVVTHDIVVEPATALPIAIRTADGMPVAGVWAAGLAPGGWSQPIRVTGDTCAAYHLDGKPRLVVVYEPKKRLFGTLSLKGDETEPVTVTLGPGGGTIEGRLVGKDRKPLAGVEVRVSHAAPADRSAEAINEYVRRGKLVVTDANGRFRIDDVIPGLKCDLSFNRGGKKVVFTVTVEPGRTTTVSELRLGP
jgi:RNA polymerase sigma factor (sigma-70 family)